MRGKKETEQQRSLQEDIQYLICPSKLNIELTKENLVIC